MKKIGNYAFQNCKGLKAVYCYAEETPKASSYAFWKVNTGDVLLIVPEDAVEQYKAHNVWKKFWIETPTKIAPFSEATRGETFYDLNGRSLSQSQKGINIVRTSDGTTRKVLVK